MSEDVMNSIKKEKIIFAIPKMHAYCHDAKCLRSLHPQRVEGAGLTDGEASERNWSYLGRFSLPTHEMTKNNRNDHLEDIFWNHLQKKQERLGNVLLKRIRNLEKAEVKNKDDIEAMMKSTTYIDDDGNEQQACGYTLRQGRDFDHSERIGEWDGIVTHAESIGREVRHVQIPTPITEVRDELRMVLISIKKSLRQRDDIVHRKGTKMAGNIMRTVKRLNTKAKSLVDNYNRLVPFSHGRLMN
jgi:hypothetical protein